MSKKKKIINNLLDGLVFDGAHHKQYYIYQALLLIYGSKENIYKKLAKDYDISVEEYIKEYGEIDEGISA